MKVFLKTSKSDLDHDPSNGSLSKSNQLFLESFDLIPANFISIGSVVFARKWSRTHMHTDRKTKAKTYNTPLVI